MKGLEARTANFSQVRVDKRERTALNTSQLEMASSKIWQWNGGVWLYRLLQLSFKDLYVAAKTFYCETEESCVAQGAVQIPDTEFSEGHKEQIKPCSCVLFIYTLHHTQPSAFISALCWT